MTEVGCWAHARRHFHDALQTDQTPMGTVLAFIAQLYKMEKTARERSLGGEDRRILREQGSRPVLDQLDAYLLRIRQDLLPKSPAGQAVAYALNHCNALVRYCEDGDLDIDNNAAERSPRGFAVGRNNWTFFGSDNGGKPRRYSGPLLHPASATRSIPGLVHRRAGPHWFVPVNQLDQLLPHNWSAASQ
jgi:transposase